MANLKELRGRIKSVSNISQITKAMEMVASMKLRKVQAKAQSNAPYTAEIHGMVNQLAGRVSSEESLALFTAREVKTLGIFLVSSDRGLCGSYNSNVFGKLHKLEAAWKTARPDVKLKFYVYGKKGYAYLTKRGYEVERFFVEPPLDKMNFNAAKIVADALTDAFLDETVDEVALLYSEFTSMVRFTPSFQPFLPVQSISLGCDDNKDRARLEGDFIFEPGPREVLEQLIPRYLEIAVYDAMLQSLTSEHASRRMAMKGATDAAGRMTKELKQIFNRARQESITKELLDIIGGANAVS